MDDVAAHNEYDSDEDMDDFLERPNEDIHLLMKNYQSKLKKYKTQPYLTKYERTKILSERSSQIDDGSVIYLDDYSLFDNSYEIACEELKQRKLPFIIKRPYGNTFEYWKLADLQ